MSAQKRITRKEMKEDKLVTTAFRVTEYIQNNRQPFILALIAIITIGAVFYYVSASAKTKKADSIVQLGKADMALFSGDVEGAISEYWETINNFGSTLNGKKAYILLGRTYCDTREYEKAIESFEEYLDKFEGKEPVELERAALVGMAVAHRGLGERIEAAGFYLKAIDAGASQDEKGYLLLDAARCYRDAGENEKARAVYKKVMKEHRYTDFQITANKELGEVAD